MGCDNLDRGFDSSPSYQATRDGSPHQSSFYNFLTGPRQLAPPEPTTPAATARKSYSFYMVKFCPWEVSADQGCQKTGRALPRS